VHRPEGVKESLCHAERSEASAFVSLKTNKSRFLAESTLSTQSEILRFAQDDSEGLGMTRVGYSLTPSCAVEDGLPLLACGRCKGE